MLCEFENEGAGGWMMMGSGPAPTASAVPAPPTEPEPVVGYDRLLFVPAWAALGCGLAFAFGYVSERWEEGAGGGGEKYTGSGGGLDGACDGLSEKA